jgi:hypothetical protein
MTDLSKLMQNAAILEVIDKSADEASSLSAQNSYQAMRIEELERESDKLRSLWDTEFRRAEKAEAENAALRAAIIDAIDGKPCPTPAQWKQMQAAIDAAREGK